MTKPTHPENAPQGWHSLAEQSRVRDGRPDVDALPSRGRCSTTRTYHFIVEGFCFRAVANYPIRGVPIRLTCQAYLKAMPLEFMEAVEAVDAIAGNGASGEQLREVVDLWWREFSNNPENSVAIARVVGAPSTVRAGWGPRPRD